jgi:glutamate formiminotransferase
MQAIECVPNVSEGRRPEVIEPIVTALRAVEAVRVLDVSSDASHNRTVISMVGSHASLRDAVLVLFELAIAAIDLRAHTGAHPRLGAIDVVPFIPIEGITMRQCVALARDTGAAVASRFGIPVFLYEEAATTAARRNLADIRRGEFENLAAKLALPEWQPDFGPRAPHPTAGATVIGARMPLIAFNVNLATNRLDIAKSIAVKVRESSGGLPAVKALGVPTPNPETVQVSMNLTNYEQTSLRRVFDAVSAEASRHNVAVAGSEIVGLVPAAALADVDVREIRLTAFSTDQILEHRL